MQMWGRRREKYLLRSGALLRVSRFRCLARFSGRIVRSGGDSFPRERGAPPARRAMNRPGYVGFAP